MGPFSSSRRNKYILVVVEYLSKWVEAKALPTDDPRVVCKLLKNLFAKFGTPRAIISDRGTHFCRDQFAKVVLKFGVTHRLATPYHPQTSGHVEALKHANLDLQIEGDHRKVQLNELHDQAYENSLIYKEKTKRLHDSKIKDCVFNIGDRVLIFNSRLKIFSEKLKSYWSGPFTISHVFPYGTVELSQPDGPNFKLNGHRLKQYFGEDNSGQMKVSNHGLKRILERAVDENRASWSDKLDDALWAFRTTYKTPIESGDHRKVQINELNELRDQAYENSLIYKEKTKRLHDSKIKNRVFNIGDKVLLFNFRLKIFFGKLKSRWSGPFTISQVYPYGTVELSQLDEPNFKVNGHRLKHYFGDDIPKLVVPYLQTFFRDH
nr:reverse transcriptase domain-containing protein [Tanacetum cinerariifolium]